MKLTKSVLKSIIREEISNYKNRTLNESVDTIDEYMNELKSIIKKHFPKSFMEIRKMKLKDGLSISVKFGIGTKGDWEGGRWENDPVGEMFFISGFNDDGTVKDTQSLDTHSAGTYRTEQGRNSITFKPLKNVAPDKVLSSIDKYYSTLKKNMIKDVDRMNFLPDDEWVSDYL